jgi:hypothetical protein
MSDYFVDNHQFVDLGDMTHHTVNGEHRATAIENVFGGHDYTNNHSHLFESTMKNPMGGTDVTRDGHLTERTVPNALGGHDVFDGNMQLKLSTVKNEHGGHDTLSEGKLISTSIPTGHGTSTLVHWNNGNSDPLAHVGEFVMSKLVL